MVWKRNEVMKQENRLDSDESRRFLVERAMGIEPTSSAWKADILADVRCPHIRFYRDASSIIACSGANVQSFFVQRGPGEKPLPKSWRLPVYFGAVLL